MLEIEERTSLGLLRDALARALFAMANELAAQVADSKQPEKTRKAAGEITTRFLEGFRR